MHRYRNLSIGSRASSWCFAVAAFLTLLVPVYGEGVDGAADVVLGYDDNPRALFAGDGVWFAGFGAEVSHDLGVLGNGTLLVHGRGDFRTYEGGGDAGRGEVDLAAVFPPETFLGAGPSLSAGLGMVRDDLFPEDERNEAFLKARIDWQGNGILAWGMENLWGFADFLNEQRVPVSPGPGPMLPGMGPPNVFAVNRPGHGGPPMYYTGRDRDDIETTFQVDASVYAGATVTITALSGFGHRWSSLDSEEAGVFLVGMGTEWTPFPAISLSGELSLARENFTEPFEGRDRTDRIHRGELRLATRHGRIGVSVRGEWTERNSPVESESYTRTVVECGLTVAF